MEDMFLEDAKEFLKEDAERNKNGNNVCCFRGAKITDFSKEELITLLGFMYRELEDTRHSHQGEREVMANLNRLRR